MAKVIFLLHSKLEDIDFSDLKELKCEYFMLLERNKFPIPPTGHYSKMIGYLKRKDESNQESIGPYKNITLFEAANRIASDLVIINGLIQLTQEKKLNEPRFTLRLGTTHISGKGDFSIKIGDEEMEGEAFNVAPSFLKGKLYKTTTKWKEKNLSYILINDDAFEGFKGRLDGRIFKVKNWINP
ncbi:MAG: hypothetical protein L6Q78_10015 [Bacteroidia bacterium]|nr:hypothetical protein [Bacteroidia bacterium]